MGSDPKISCMSTLVSWAVVEKWPLRPLLLKAESLFGALEINADLSTMSRNHILSV